MANSGNHTNTIQGHLEPAGFFQITTVKNGLVATSLVDAMALLSPAAVPPKQSKLVLIQARAQNVRWRDDGVAPTALVGQILVANDTLVYTGKFDTIQFMEVVSGAVLNLTFYK